jgi:hypothetical protein
VVEQLSKIAAGPANCTWAMLWRQKRGRRLAGTMKLFLLILVWLIAYSYFPTAALAALVLFVVLWVFTLPIRVVRLIFQTVFGLIRGIVLLPIRLLR